MSLFQRASVLLEQMEVINRSNKDSALASAASDLSTQVFELAKMISFMIDLQKGFKEEIWLPKTSALVAELDKLREVLEIEGLTAVQMPAGSQFSTESRTYIKITQNAISDIWKSKFSIINDVIAKGESLATKVLDLEARNKFRFVVHKWTSLSSRILPKDKTLVDSALGTDTIDDWPDAIMKLSKQVEDAAKDLNRKGKLISDETSNFIDLARRKGGVPLSDLTLEILNELLALPGIDDFIVSSK